MNAQTTAWLIGLGAIAVLATAETDADAGAPSQDVYQETFTFPLSPGSAQIDFEKFDTMGGTRVLEQVTIAIDGLIGANVSLENRSVDLPLEPAEVSATGNLSVLFGGSSVDVGYDQVFACPNGSILEPDDGVLFSGPDFCSFGFVSMSGSDMQIINTGLDVFVGPGTLTATIEGDGRFSFEGTVPFALLVTGFHAEGSVMVTYQYGLVTGACCLPDGSCVDGSTLSDCQDVQGGLWQGTDTTCAAVSCAQPSGACCLANGSCIEVTEAACAGQGGGYQGNSTSCAGVSCPQPSGACCLANGSCIEATEAACVGQGGGYQGDSTSCAGVSCPQPSGACCLANGSCIEVTEAACAGQGGAYQGDSTSCAGVSCPQPSGACCLANGSCIEATEAACAGQGGGYQGDSTSCAGVSCPQPSGACCLANGSCIEVTQTACAAQGGAYQGAFTQCAVANCPEPAVACCLPNGACVMVSVTACLAQGGEPQGDQSNCASVSCPQPPERAHPGWNWVDVGVMLTKNQPAYWSALTGQPGPGGSAVSPFTIVDPSLNPLQQGRPALDGTTDRVLRGFVYAWAVDAFNREISWNHLKGDATIVNYRDGAAWEYNAWAFQVVAPVAHGVHTGITPGQLDLDGVEYVPGFAQLQLDFYAAGSSALSGGSGPFAGDLVTDTELVLHPIVADLRQETVGPITTKANFVIWNEDETQLTGLHRCITCWDQTLISLYAGFNNHFLLSNLQTDKGRARIDGIASQQCDFLPPFEDSSVSVSLLGVAAKHISFASGARLDSAGTNLIGMGIEPQVAAIQYDLGSGPPPTLVDPDSGGRPALQPRGGRGLSLADSNMMMSESIAATPDRVSGSEKGSLLVFSKVEIRWDELGNVVQDTFLDISNDFPADVQVQMYFINGDPPLDATDSLTLEEPTTPQELLPWLIEQVDRSIKRYKQE